MTKLLDVVLESAWWRYSVEEIWNKLEYNKDLQQIIQWRMGNQDRQERIQRRDEAKHRWRARNALRMELGDDQGDWWDTELQEHRAMDYMMMNLGIYDDMEIGEEHESSMDENIRFEVDEALEHAFLDKCLKEWVT